VLVFGRHRRPAGEERSTGFGRAPEGGDHEKRYRPSLATTLGFALRPDRAQRFEVISDVTVVEPITAGRGIRELRRLRRRYGRGRWRKMKGVATIRLADGRVRRAELHWDEAHGIGRKEVKRKRYPARKLSMARSSGTRFAVCIDNSGYPASLDLHKIYRVLPDREAEEDGDIRIVDESGEDYLFEADRFLPVDLPPKTERVLNRSFARFGAETR